MILGDPALATRQAQHEQRLAIDEIFRHVAAQRPGAAALIDAPNRATFTDGSPRRLTFAEADRMAWAIAGRLRLMGLPTDSVVGIQMPNTVENILTLLGVLRAGLIAAPLPLLWRRTELAAALGRVDAKALITCARSCGFEYAQMATHVALDVFSIRYVCGFGPDLPDGVVPFDDLFTAATIDPVPTLERDRHGNAVAHVAVITFDIDDSGPVPVARNHLELLAGGLCVFLEGGLEPQAVLLSTVPPASFAGICLSLLPWLLAGGTLALHHPFDPGILTETLHDERCGTLIVPAPVAFRLAESGRFAAEGPSRVLAIWRSPEQLAGGGNWAEPNTALVDVAVFAETGLIATRRNRDGDATALAIGPVQAPRGSRNAMTLAEAMPTESGSLALRGPMVPRHPYRPGILLTSPLDLAADHDGFIDTGYGCRVDAATKTLVVTAPPAGMASVGGYRFALAGLCEALGRFDGAAMLAAMPDRLTGQRLVGNAVDCAALARALESAGFNPIVVNAFRDRAAADLRQAMAG